MRTRGRVDVWTFCLIHLNVLAITSLLDQDASAKVVTVPTREASGCAREEICNSHDIVYDTVTSSRMFFLSSLT